MAFSTINVGTAANDGTGDPLRTALTKVNSNLSQTVNTGNNLSDLASAPTARTNLGLGTAATLASTAVAQTANNLSDLASPGTSRTNLGLGSAALLASTALCQTANNLSDLANSATARTNLGLGNASTLAGTAQGQVAYYNGSAWVTLSPGTSGQVLQTAGTGANPIWATVSGGGGLTQATIGTGLYLTGSVLGDTGMFNVKHYGAIGNGASHPLSGVTSCQGTNTTGFTLTQWQGIFPHATALSNELDWAAAQAAVNAATANGYGVVFFPGSTSYGYVFDQELVLPVLPVVGVTGALDTASRIYWPTDLGAGKFGIRTATLDNPDRPITIQHLTLQGSTTWSVGNTNYLMSGIRVSNNFQVEHCNFFGLYAGIAFINDHSKVSYIGGQGCYYGFYWMGASAGNTSYGNHLVSFCNVATMYAVIAVAWDSGIDTSAFYSSTLGFSPFGIYKEARPGGQSGTPGNFITNSTFVDTAFEACGAAAIWDAGTTTTGGYFSNNSFDNFNFALTTTAFFQLSGFTKTAAIQVNIWSSNRVIGSQAFFAQPTLAIVTTAGIIARTDLSNNTFGDISGLIGDVNNNPGKVILQSGGACLWNEWRSSTNYSGIFIHNDSGSSVAAGTLMKVTFGGEHTQPHSAGNPLFGIAANIIPNGTMGPIATNGIVTVRKTTAAAISGGRAMVASSTSGVGEQLATGNVNNAFVGVLTQSALSTDTTCTVRLNISTPQLTANYPA